MLFLIDYDRARGQIAAFRIFQDSERKKAEDARLELELKHNCLGVTREVVLLEASSEEALRRTHRRYFENLSELAGVPSAA